MKPPQCALCGERFDPAEGGGLVRFADYQPMPEGVVGHPRGLEWFCSAHLEMARSRSYLEAADAIQEMWIELSSRNC